LGRGRNARATILATAAIGSPPLQLLNSTARQPARDKEAKSTEGTALFSKVFWGRSFLLPLTVDTGDESSSNRLSALTQGEAGSFLECDLVDELSLELDVVSRHDYLLVRVLGLGREAEGDGDIGRPDKELGSVVVHEWGVSATLVLCEDIEGSEELLDRLEYQAE